MDEEYRRRLAVDIEARAVLLETTKADIEIQRQGYLKILEEIRGQLSELEIQLAEARVRTAEKKLEIIPILEAIIAAELALVEKDFEIVAANAEIVDKKGEVAAVELLLADAEIAAVAEELAAIDADKDALSEKTATLADELERASEEAAFVESTEDAEEDYLRYRDFYMSPAIFELRGALSLLASAIGEQSDILSDILSKKEEALGSERNVIEKTEAVLKKQIELSAVLSEIAVLVAEAAQYRVSVLAPAIADLVSAYERLKAAIVESISVERQISDARVDISEIDEERIDRESVLIKLEVVAKALEKSLAEISASIDDARGSNALALVREATRSSSEISAENSEWNTRTGNAETSAGDLERSLRLQASARNISAKLSRESRISTQRGAVSNALMIDRRDEAYSVAEIEAAPKILASLTHLLGI
jgi:hypothetical protein